MAYLAAEQVLQTTFARTLRKPFRQAVKQYRLLQEGDRVAVCISGGKDSMLLALLMRGLARELPLNLVYLAMDPGYAPEDRCKIEENAGQLGFPLHFFRTDILRIAGKHAPAHPCFLCAKMRRGYLYAEARRLGCSKIALGHHFDDAVESVLMGLLYGGQVQAMLPRLHSRHFPGMELIRPMYLVHEQAVDAWVAASGLSFSRCACPVVRLEQDSKRAEVKALIAELAEANPQIKQNILNAVKSVDTRKILGWRDAAGLHSFLEEFEG